MHTKNCDIILGYSCNNNCIHCVRGDDDRKTNLSLKEVFSKIDEAKSRGATRLILQGGEPTVRKDIKEIVKYANSTNFKSIQIQTNGRMLAYKDFCKDLIKFGITDFCVSLHSSNDSIHDKFTSINGSFNQTVNGIKNIVSLNQNLKILIIVTKNNYKDLIQMSEFLVNLGVKMIQIGSVAPRGHAKKKYEELTPKFEDYNSILMQTVDYLKSKDVNVLLQDIPKCYIKGYESFCLENNLPPAEKIFPEYHLTDSNSERIDKKKLLSKCESCKFYNECEGIYEEYIEIYGEDGVNPVL